MKIHMLLIQSHYMLPEARNVMADTTCIYLLEELIRIMYLITWQKMALAHVFHIHTYILYYMYIFRWSLAL